MALHNSPILEILFSTDTRYRILAITFEYETAALKIGAIPQRTIILDLRKLFLDLVAATISRFGATLLDKRWNEFNYTELLMPVHF